jgi:hypothetical protein
MIRQLALTLPGGQTINPPAGVPAGGLTTLNTALSGAITLFLVLSVILTLIFLILGGVQWISSGGDKAKIQSARGRITWAIIGLIVAMLSFFIVNLIGFFFKVDLLQF